MNLKEALAENAALRLKIQELNTRLSAEHDKGEKHPTGGSSGRHSGGTAEKKLDAPKPHG